MGWSNLGIWNWNWLHRWYEISHNYMSYKIILCKIWWRNQNWKLRLNMNLMEKSKLKIKVKYDLQQWLSEIVALFRITWPSLQQGILESLQQESIDTKNNLEAEIKLRPILIFPAADSSCWLLLISFVMVLIQALNFWEIIARPIAGSGFSWKWTADEKVLFTILSYLMYFTITNLKLEQERWVAYILFMSENIGDHIKCWTFGDGCLVTGLYSSCIVAS